MKPEPGSHPRARFRERYGLDLTLAQLRDIEARLAAGEGMLLRRQAGNQTVQVLRVGSVLVIAAFDLDTKLVRTFLPLENATKGERWRRIQRRRDRARREGAAA